MCNLVPVVFCVLSLSAASGVLAADTTASTGTEAKSDSKSPPRRTDSGRPPPLLQRPRPAKQMKLDRRYAVPLVAYRRADGSLELRDGRQQIVAPSMEVNNER